MEQKINGIHTLGLYELYKSIEVGYLWYIMAHGDSCSGTHTSLETTNNLE